MSEVRMKLKNTNIKMKHTGIHILAEFWGCEIIESISELEKIIKKAVKKSNSKLLLINSYKFNPQGLTSFGILAESHISIHTWPEKDYIAIDIFTCGDQAKPQIAVKYLELVLKPKRFQVKRILRGKYI